MFLLSLFVMALAGAILCRVFMHTLLKAYSLKKFKPHPTELQMHGSTKDMLVIVVIGNIIWFSYLWSTWKVPDLFDQIDFVWHILCTPALFVAIFEVIGVASSPLRQMEEDKIVATWHSNNKLMGVAVSIVAVLALSITYETHYAQGWYLFMPMVIFIYTNEFPNQERYLWNLNTLLTHPLGVLYTLHQLAANSEDQKREGSALHHYVDKYDGESWEEYDVQGFQREVMEHQWFLIYVLENEKVAEYWELRNGVEFLYARLLKKFERTPGLEDYHKWREKVINRYYDNPLYQTREYYHTLEWYEDKRERNDTGNLKAWPYRRDGHMQSIRQEFKRMTEEENWWGDRPKPHFYEMSPKEAEALKKKFNDPRFAPRSGFFGKFFSNHKYFEGWF